MAGVTNASFRRLCREFAESALPEHLRPATSGQIPYDGGLLAPAGLFVTEMVTTRALVERNLKLYRWCVLTPLRVYVQSSFTGLTLM